MFIWVVVARTVFFYAFLLLVLRIMGKRELGALGPLDLVVTFIMAEAAAIPIEDPERPLYLGIAPIVTIMLLEMGLSYLCLTSDKIRRLVSGSPTVVVKDGKFLRKEMRRLRYSIRDLLEQLRQKGFDQVTDVELATLESDGGLSVLPKNHEGNRNQSGRSYAVVIDGQIDEAALKELGVKAETLQTMLAEKGHPDMKNVFFALLNKTGALYVQSRDEKEGEW